MGFGAHQTDGTVLGIEHVQNHKFTGSHRRNRLELLQTFIPLRRYLQSGGALQYIGFKLHDYQIYEGNRHSLIELKLPSDAQKI
jgi:hypothetical protein